MTVTTINIAIKDIQNIHTAVHFNLIKAVICMQNVVKLYKIAFSFK